MALHRVKITDRSVLVDGNEIVDHCVDIKFHHKVDSVPEFEFKLLGFPEIVADMAHVKLDVAPNSADDCYKIFRRLYGHDKTFKATINDKVKALLESNGIDDSKYKEFVDTLLLNK